MCVGGDGRGGGQCVWEVTEVCRGSEGTRSVCGR